MTSLSLVRRIRARPSLIFEALTRPEELSTWWGPDAGPVLFAEADARVGGRFRVRFRMLDGSEHECTGEYLEVVPPRRLAMSWEWIDGGEPRETGRVSRLEFDLRPIGEETELTLTHADLVDETSRASHEQGWTGSIDKLARRHAGKSDTRQVGEKSKGRKDDHDFRFQMGARFCARTGARPARALGAGRGRTFLPDAASRTGRPGKA
jgi:uncharacterized protein YndB with AHSA1/START domain